MSTPKFQVSYTGSDPSQGQYPAGPVYTVIAVDPGNEQAIKILQDVGPEVVAALADHKITVAEVGGIVETLATDLGQPLVAAVTDAVVGLVPQNGGKVNTLQAILFASKIIGIVTAAAATK